MQYDFRSFKSLLIYMLRYLHNGHERSILLQPVDAGNGVIMHDVDDNGIMHGLTIGGHSIQLPFQHFLIVERQFRVTRFNGQTSRTEKASEARVEQIIEQNTDKKTGELDASIRNIEEVDNPKNKVTRYRLDAE